jgi:hypothetical protein
MDSIYDIANGCNSRDIKFLELGHAEGINFDKLNLDYKISVDNGLHSGTATPDFYMTTDQFFDMYKGDKFDIIYIDADHEYSQVIKDFNNSLKFISPSGVVCIHDLYPPFERMTASCNCNNGFLVLNYLAHNDYDFLTFKEDLGLTAIKTFKPIIHSEVDNVSYREFIAECSNINFDDRFAAKNYLDMLTFIRDTIKKLCRN